MNDRDEELEKKIKKFDRAVLHYLFTIVFSMLTAILTTLALTGKL